MALNVEFNSQSKRIKVTPNTTMFRVLTESREQFDLRDSRQYHLLHRGKPIDLSIPFRLTGISNNASVELAELERTLVVQQVRVCIQLHDGKRVQATFGSDTTIECMLTFFKLLPASKQFFLGFLRREINYDAFSTTTLKELGIVSGSAMFRVQIADEQLPLAASSAQSPSTPPQTRHVSFPSIESTPPGCRSSVPETLDCVPEVQSEDVEMKDAAAEHTIDVGIQKMSTYDALQMLRDNSFDAVSRIAIVTLLRIVTNILSDPENKKLRAIRLSNTTFCRSVGQVKGGIEFLTSIGFAVIPESQMLVLNLDPRDTSLLEEGLRLLSIEADDLNISSDTRPVLCEEKADPTFDVFKTQITRVQMQPRGPSSTAVLVDALKSKQEQLIGNDKPPRNTTVFLEGKRSSGSIGSVLDSSERSDAQILISSLKARQVEMEKTKNFRTRAMRELDELKRKRVFQTVLIRVQFPDRAVMQASFHPNETIQDVMDHVTKCLDDQYKASKFYLYVTPPTQRLAATKTLVELNLVPAALTYLSWLEVPPQAEVASVGFYFCGDVLADECAESKEKVGSSQNTDYPKPLQLESLPAAKTESCEEPPRQTSARAESSKKKPSWFKL
ncbi:unnamed protein product [Peronospora farinosa]|uniref:UBX domain-containing protein n=2 Tax=Peronospora farinosa TaxID=134698 RepID=A0AAV0UKZ7_9STRA|nr:unnamed protein product [Peronospora farinosa]